MPDWPLRLAQAACSAAEQGPLTNGEAGVPSCRQLPTHCTPQRFAAQRKCLIAGEAVKKNNNGSKNGLLR